MPNDTPIPLATIDQFMAGPFKNLVIDWDPNEVENYMMRATRRIESMVDRRLALFTGLVESKYLSSVAVDDTITTFQPMEEMATLGYSRAMSLDGGSLVRHLWLSQKPPIYEDLWLNGNDRTGMNIQSITLRRSFSGDQQVNIDTLQYEPDTGHIRFALGTYAPPGTTAIVVYNGGYSTVPDDLVTACMFMTAKMIIITMEPQNRPAVDLTEIDNEIESSISPYDR